MTPLKLSVLTLIILVVSLAACEKEAGENRDPDSPLTPYRILEPEYLPRLSLPGYNPLTVEGIALGRQLYYDTILSNNGRSCASCHFQEYAFSSPVANSQPHINLAWNNKFLWNGREEGDLEQVTMFEVREFFRTDVSKLQKHPDYPDLFRKIFRTVPITEQQVAYALAQFMRTQVSLNSKFDRYMRYEINLEPSELRGLVIFNTEKGDCFHCHSLGLFQDNGFHNIGLDSSFSGMNLGRYNVTFNPADIGKFKTPTLRNVSLTAPYMHDGRYPTLEAAIEHYNSKVINSSTLDPVLTKPNHTNGLQLTAQDKADLLDFLLTLTDTSFIHDPALSKP